VTLKNPGDNEYLEVGHAVPGASPASYESDTVVIHDGDTLAVDIGLDAKGHVLNVGLSVS